MTLLREGDTNENPPRQKAALYRGSAYLPSRINRHQSHLRPGICNDSRRIQRDI